MTIVTTIISRNNLILICMYFFIWFCETSMACSLIHRDCSGSIYWIKKKQCMNGQYRLLTTKGKKCCHIISTHTHWEILSSFLYFFDSHMCRLGIQSASI